MIAIQQVNPLSPEDYIEAEKSSSTKHEYHNGHVYAMAGASDEHVTIGVNITSLLRGQIRGTGCRVYSSDMKVQIDAVNYYYYPDVMVSCDQRDRDIRFFKKHPILIIEVLSDSTEAKDRGQKFEHYRTLESLKEYVLVSQDRQRVEVFRKNNAGQWVLYSFGPGDDVTLTSVGWTVAIAAFYEDVDLLADTGSA